MEENINVNDETKEVEKASSSETLSIPNKDLAQLINSWFVNIRNVIKTVKEKDANLYKMNNELQAYRNGYSRQLFKSLAQNLINFREDCAKSLRDAEKYYLEKDDIVKYIGYVADDFEMLLENIGIEIGETVKLNGTEINDKPSETEVFALPENQVQAEEEITEPIEEPVTQAKVMELLDRKTQEIKAILSDNAALDVVVGEYVKQSQLIERNEQQIVLYPVIREIVDNFNKVKEEVAAAQAYTEANEAALLNVYKEIYKEILGKVLGETESILNLCQVTVANALSGGDMYDPKCHRIMKFIAIGEEESEKNGKIVNVYSDMYMMDDKVFYPAKVDVYKVK